jgi:tetratricopeptide (TPR) repeat protein
VVIANWQPVTNLSFLLVSQFWGIAPGPHHLANAVLHAANAGLLFLLLWRLTNSHRRSAVAAGIFAWHPLRVESVAWIVERKDVLCAFFFLLALLFYASFAKESNARPPSGAKSSKAKLFYIASLLAFLLALLSKPMAVTLPCVLLLLDVWPLARIRSTEFRIQNLSPLFLEKIPFFALMILFCAATYVIQRNSAAMTPWDKLGLTPRVATAISGYLAYPTQLFWPFNLAVTYPYQNSFDTVQVFLKALLLLVISLGCLKQLPRRPWLAVGWFWYLGTAVPIIGLVQVGGEAMADRYTYLPLIGPVVALVWTAAEWFSRIQARRILLSTAAIIILAGLALVSARQLQYWQNTITLFAHNVEVTPANSSAEFTLGLGYEHAGDTNHAVVCYRTAKIIAPEDFQNRRNLAALVAREGYPAAAEAEYHSLVAQEPTECRDRLGLSGVLEAQGRLQEALDELDETVRLNPDCVDAFNNLAWTLATSPHAELRDGPRAVALAQHACELTQFRQTIYIGTLGAAQAEAGKFDDAIATAQRACALATESGETNLLQRNRNCSNFTAPINRCETDFEPLIFTNAG